MNAIELLLNRNSSPRLKEPAPNGEDRELIFQAAFRAPDHARLRPWRFLTVEGKGREALGELFAASLKQRKPDATAQELDKVRAQPMRAPLLVIAIASIKEHDKVPEVEQLLSAGCATHSMLLAAQSLGYAGIWRTGDNAFDRSVMKGLGLEETEKIVGFLYLGSLEGAAKPIPLIEANDFVQSWP